MTRYIKKYWPDEPKEYAYIGSAIGRLGAAMTGFAALSESTPWTLTALFFSWLGFEINGYFKIQDKNDEPNAA